MNSSSTAGHEVYVRGGGDVAFKHALASLTQSLRKDLPRSAVRVTEVAPGMVRAEEFSVDRTGELAKATDAVYAGVDNH